MVQDEKEFQKQLVLHLEEQGFQCQEYVYCSVGIADLVVDNAVIEVKHWVERADLFKAIGQALLYRESINKKLDAKVICLSRLKDRELEIMANTSKQAGVEIIFWEPGDPLVFEQKIWNVPNTYQIDDICSLSSLCCSQLLRYNRCWAIVTETYDYACKVQLWNGQIVVANQHLKNLNLSSKERQEILSMHRRFVELTKCQLDPIDEAQIEFLCRRPWFTPRQKQVLSAMEAVYDK
ncbi:MAG: hypothetical protein CLLPBCKN_007625 [Chroococcidiopsis cubana SAG 39.79]|uniref:Restriction endonuclease type IV Mrr domain-containing protein n=1 Tax=Chroococcidiopsis cubana SAG 39.79 TaxID=388085 RepID=A0AB37UTH0_9CYAN|nr:hypothetical protein [Chroococcidiopsis cubana]MDZ4878190.1 hypothetical protein [Chroococcidiopsis cubana SAG 39.79]PSB66567.1 hypothetical protein C7B79_00490 [Chroococcidiopsis cubana CCALA 043]RUT14546.1 hypothetical protein DSM107010_00920 [Chroococcidiopsis cubana SAG 39.79]